MPLQTYESIDWIAEAERVRKAFGVVGECEFRPSSHRSEFGGMWLDKVGTPNIKKEGYRIGVNIDREQIYFSLSENRFDYGDQVELIISGESFRLPSKCQRFHERLARALFHLDLLTIEVETALGVSISAHEKLEWTAEYDAEYGAAI